MVFLRYFESARIAYLNETLEQHDPVNHGGGYGFIFASCHIDYRSPGHFDEEVAIECSVGEIRRSAFQMRFAMTVDDRLVADGYGWLVGFDYETLATKAVAMIGPTPGRAASRRQVSLARQSWTMRWSSVAIRASSPRN